MTNKRSYKYLPVFFVGFIDGIIVPLTIYSFFNRVLGTSVSAIQITLAVGFVMSLLLSAGAYLTRKTELQNSGEIKLLEIYANLGLNKSLQQKMAEDTISEQLKWQTQCNEAGNAALGFLPGIYSFIVWLGYTAGLLLVLLNAYLWPVKNLGFLIVPVCILALAGFMKYKTANQKPIAGMLTVAISGLIAALANWLIAGLF